MSILKPWTWFPPQFSHDYLSPAFLKIYGHYHQTRTITWTPFAWRGLEFTNRLGLAGGVDKDATQIVNWWTLGCGFVEIGTVTPLPQPPNPGRIMDRDSERKALWNRMGFPGRGGDFVLKRLRRLYQPHFTPIFVNIGKNRNTSIEKASDDYCTLLRKLHSEADAFVINISSPNTQNLRQLQSENELKSLLKRVQNENRGFDSKRPLLVKLSPDLDDDELKSVLDVCVESEIDGWILTNTTTHSSAKKNFPEQGGVSGAPLADLSRHILSVCLSHLGNEREGRLIVSCGGVLSPQDVLERLQFGADLVQVYSALVFEGPFFFDKVAQFMEIQARLNPKGL